MWQPPQERQEQRTKEGQQWPWVGPSLTEHLLSVSLPNSLPWDDLTESQVLAYFKGEKHDPELSFSRIQANT